MPFVPATAWILSFVLLGSGENVPLDVRFPDGTEVFHCTFDPTWDANYDGWPDQWTRRRGPGYPHYLRMQINDEASPSGNHCLRMEMDGGAATAYSPPIQVCSLFSYVMEAYLRADGLEHSTVFLSVTFLDEERQRLETVTSKQFRQTDGWQKVRIGPIAPADDNVRFAIIALHVEPSDREDLRGSAGFADIWLARLPRMTLSANQSHNLFFDTRDVEILCHASGFTSSNPTVSLRLTDAVGNDLCREDRQLEVRTAETHVAVSLETFAEGASGLVGETRWRPDIPGPGFYRVEAAMHDESELVYQRRLGLALIDSRETVPNIEFGWTLPGRGQALPSPLLGQLIRQVGIGRVKYPLWFGDERNEQEVEREVGFIERLGTAGIELIGMLDKPPQSLRSKLSNLDRQDAASIFAPDPKVWYPFLEPVMTRLATRVRWWQLGNDLDTSFVDTANPVAKLREVKAELDRIGQNVSVGLAWPWTHEFPSAGKQPIPWRFVALSAEPVLTAQELAVSLEASKGLGASRWVALQPLSTADYSPEVRATDLVFRMIAAKIHGADAIFCPDPFNDERGLMNRDGTPGELLFPWRIASMALGGATYLGRLDLPNGSPNHVFTRRDDAVMIVWSWQPTEEVVQLGSHVVQLDLWGHETPLRTKGDQQRVEVTRVPTFLVGLNPDIASWRMNCHLAQGKLPSVSAMPHPNSYSFRNTFDHGIVGRATIVAPDGWKVEPSQITFRLAEGESMEQPFTVTLPFDATTGRHPVRIDFDIQTVPAQQFSVYRHIDVGLGFVYIEIETRWNDRDELEVVQRMVNDGPGSVTFRCQLFIPGMRRMMTQVVNLARGYNEQVYPLFDATGLVGETLWLRAEEVNGPRVLNYRCNVPSRKMDVSSPAPSP